MIAVIDYGAGNLHSVANALDLLASRHPFEYRLVRSPEELSGATAILLPGVGHFGQMVAALEKAGLTEALRERLAAGTPYLGICLGMHALYESSEEAPGATGLGLLRGRVLRFPPGQKVPHMGWTEVEQLEPARLRWRDPASAPALVRRERYYFAHSYYVPADAEGVAATARHGISVAAMVRRGNLMGTQFHPEKSGSAGLALLGEWVQSVSRSPDSAICNPQSAI